MKVIVSTDVEAFSKKLAGIIERKSLEKAKGLRRIRGSVDVTFEDPEKRDKGTFKLVGCYGLSKGFPFRKIYYFDVTFSFTKGPEGYILELSDIKSYTMDRGVVSITKMKPPEDLINLVKEDLTEAGAKIIE
ncbi:MAG: hypothetical protein DRJ66_04530 [Thermoprotei archaeon]|nr:MAG: hypothetical protein DRJ66_04530 [Thermoprotei archaeon]RLF21043.1 MAG: hypothetical protein DRZ82_00200 [Thermoprotei archaeon]